MGSAHVIKEMRMTLPGDQIWLSTISLDAQPFSFSHGVTRVDI